MSAYPEQGEGALVPGRGAKIVTILVGRKFSPTRVALENGETCVGANWSWGRDIGADWEHVYFAEDGLDFFLSTEQIIALHDPATSEKLFSREDT
ncbi:MAG: hypothetical protein NVV62_12640 [Terricaulis sp.]|nr:hypothetical protein [Terricaulis sp.]